MSSGGTLFPELLQTQVLQAELLQTQVLQARGRCSQTEQDFHDEPPLPGKALEQMSLSHKPEEHPPTKLRPESPMCRICHEGDLQEALVAPCECLGTMASVHRSCLEQWFSASGTSACELCHFQFSVQRRPRPLLEWLHAPGLRREKRTLLGDLLCFVLITPLASVSGWLCLRGAVDHLHFSSRLEALGLIGLTVALFSIYLFWTLVSLRYHCRVYHEWRVANQSVVLLLPAAHHETPRLLSGSQRRTSLSKESIV